MKEKIINIIPVLHRVIVKPEMVEEADEMFKRAKAAGLHIEFDKREKKAVTIGIVVKVGSTCFEQFGSSAEKEGITEGSKIYYAKYAGAEIPGTEYMILNDEDVIGVIKDE